MKHIRIMKHLKVIATVIGASILPVLSACGGGGGGGGSVPATWGTTQMIKTGGGTFDNADSPQIAIDGSGNATAVWAQSDGNNVVSIWANRFSAGNGTWGTAKVIGTVGAVILSDHGPQIAVDAGGNALVVWKQPNSTGKNNIWANRFSAVSGTWGTAELIQTANADSARAPQIAMDGNGNAIAVWAQSADANAPSHIWANRFSAASGAWEMATALETAVVGGAVDPRIALDTGGNALVVWSQSDVTLTRTDIWANRYSAGSGWGTAQLIEHENAGDALRPQIAFDASGNAIAVWEQSDGSGGVRIWANRFSPAITGVFFWGTAGPIEADAGGATFPQIVINAGGNALAVWSQFGSGIWGNRFSAGSGWGAAQFLGGGAGAAPRIAINRNGSAIAAVWTQFDGTRFNVWANHFSAGNSWGAAELIETDDAGSAASPQIAIDEGGNAIAVWQQRDLRFGSPVVNIWANRSIKATP